MSQANNSRWFQPWTYEGFSYLLPRCLFKFDYSHACKQASVKDLQTIVSSKEFFHVDLRLWLSTEKKLRVLKTPFEVIVSVETVSKRPQDPLPSVNIPQVFQAHVSRKSKILLHERVTPSYNRNNSDGKASQKRQRTPQTIMDKQRVNRFCYSYA